MQLKQIAKAVLLGAGITFLAACDENDTKIPDNLEETPTTTSLKVLHINDHHSHLQANSRMNLILDGKATRVEMGGFPRVVRKMKELESHNGNV